MEEEDAGWSHQVSLVLLSSLAAIGSLAEEVFVQPIQDLWAVTHATSGGNGERPSCLELFAGVSEISGAFGDKGYGVLRPRDLWFGDDLRDVATRRAVVDEVRLHRPKLVWAAPPCTVWCGFSNLNYTKQQLRRLRAKERPFLELLDEILVEQRRCGGHVIIENPRHSALWNQKVLSRWADDPGCAWVDFDMCTYGLKSADGVAALRKPVRLLATHALFAEELGRQCAGGHEHRRIEGKETSRTAHYPPAFAAAVVRAFEKLEKLDCQGGHGVYVQDEVVDDAAGVRADGSRDITFKGSVSGPVAGALRRLHQNLGHLPNRELVRQLRLAGASQAMVDAAHGLSCRACQRCLRPHPRPVARPAALLDFNEAVALDIIYIDTNESPSHLALNMVDVGSSFQVVAPLKNREAATVARVFLKYWVSWAGTPGRLVLDLDTAFVGSFADLTSDTGIAMRAAAGQAHWQNGIAERYGASWKDCWERLCAAEDIRDADLRDAICAVNDARNTLRNRSGFSPRQWVFGTNGRLSPDPVDGGHELSTLASVTPEGLMGRKQAIRHGARLAFHQTQGQEGIARALAHKSRVQLKEYQPGDMVYYYRLDRRRGKQKQAMWRGPATVIGREGDNYWLARGGRCILAAGQHMRSAVHEEVSELIRIKAALRQVQEVIEEDYPEQLEEEELAEDVEMDAVIPVPAEDQPLSGPGGDVSPRGPAVRRKLAAIDEQEKIEAHGRKLRSLDDVPLQMQEFRAEGSQKEVHMTSLKKGMSPEAVEKALEKEIPWHLIPPEERALYRAAEATQWAEHVDFGAVRALSVAESDRVRAEVGEERILNARFLYRDKNRAKRRLDATIPCKPKARLCVGGQKDPDLGVMDINVDAPTAGRHSILLGLQLALNREWRIAIGDIRAAFLNGVQAPRGLYFKQPVRGIPGLHPRQLVEIIKGVFGLATSPKLWWLRLSKELVEIAFTHEDRDYYLKQNPIDPCAFHIIGKQSPCHSKEETCGMIFTHVDDLLVMTQPSIHSQIRDAIKARFPVDEWEEDNFEYVGCEYQIRPDSIRIGQSSYVKARLNKIRIPPHESEDELAPAEAVAEHKSVVGCLSWLAKQTRADIQFMVSQSQRAQLNPKISDLKWTNAAVDIAKKFVDETVNLRKLDEATMCVYGYHDAAWANVNLEGESVGDQQWDSDVKKASQLASLVLLGERGSLSNEMRPCSVVDWRSKSSARICRSTFAGETMACSDALEGCIYLRGLYLSFTHGYIVPEDEARRLLHIHLFTDCKSLYDHMHKDGIPKAPTERRLALDLAAMRQELQKEALGQWQMLEGDAEVRPDRPRRPPLHWLPTDLQLADILTKRMSPSRWWDMMRPAQLAIPLRVWGHQEGRRH